MALWTCMLVAALLAIAGLGIMAPPLVGTVTSPPTTAFIAAYRASGDWVQATAYGVAAGLGVYATFVAWEAGRRGVERITFTVLLWAARSMWPGGWLITAGIAVAV